MQNLRKIDDDDDEIEILIFVNHKAPMDGFPIVAICICTTYLIF